MERVHADIHRRQLKRRYPDNGKSYPIFIDDITITQIDNGKPGAPLAQAATNVSDTQFTANWQAVEGAEGYLLSVYTLKTPQSSISSRTRK